MNGGANSALPANILFRQLFKVAATEEIKREEKRRGSKGSLVDSPLFRRKLMEIAGTEKKEAEESIFRQSDQVNQANNSTSLIQNVDIDLAKTEKENLREIITDNVAENFQSQSNYQDENNDISLVEVLVETPSIKSRSTDCTLKSKEEDNRKKSKASEVFEKYKFLNRNDDINSKSHVQPVETDINNSEERRKQIRIIKYKDKKDSVHSKKNVTTINDNLPVLAITNTKISCRGRKAISIHQQKQDSTQINQLVIETTEKTAENHSIGKVDSSNSINIFHVEDTSSRKKLFQVDESNTKQDILQKKYSSK